MNLFRSKFTIISVLALLVIVLSSTAQYNLKDNKMVYVTCYAHLDTQWGWDMGKTISSWIPNTFRDNFSHFSRFDHYVFSFEGAYRYYLMKQYYPSDYSRLKTYVQEGKWAPTGSFVDGCDVNIPSPESIIRHILYGNAYFEEEFDKTSIDILLPDCFGFPYTLPTIATHCGIFGFSTQKFHLWGGWTETPFPIGLWEGVDGSQIIACLKPGSYGDQAISIRETDGNWVKSNSKNNGSPGVWVTYDYCGTGDVGGAPGASGVQTLENRINQNGSEDIKAVCAPSDQIFWDFLDYPQLIDGLPVYNGELVMKTHGVGCYTSWSKIKLKNRQNERAATGAEHAAVMANYLSDNSYTYPKQKLWFAWFRFLDHQMHDDLTGTSINRAYTQYTMPAQDSSLAEFREVMTGANTEMAKLLNTNVEAGRTPVVVYNPLGVARKDIVETVIQLSGTLPENIQVFDPEGTEVPSQIIQRAGTYLSFAFAADMPAMGYKVYQLSPTVSSLTSELKITTSELENEHYKVTVNSVGDIEQIFDKKLQQNLLSSPSRFELRNDDGNLSFPAWEITHNSVTRSPSGYVDGGVQKSIEENGPARVTLKITRNKSGSDYTHYIRLGTGDAGSFIEVDNVVDWKQSGHLLKISFPFSCSNDSATFDLGIGAINRPNYTTNRYEVPAQQWADITNTDNSYGVSILSDCKYGWDKAANNLLHLTLIHSPTSSSSGYDYYTGRDKYVHPFSYGIYGHAGKWQNSNVVHEAARLDQPLIAFKATPSAGIAKTYSFLTLDKPEQVAVMALKQAEKINDYYILRVRELKGESLTGAKVSFMGNVDDVYNVTGQEKQITAASVLPRDKYKPGPVTKSGNTITFDLKRYQVRAFAVKLGEQVNIGSNFSAKDLKATVPFYINVLQRKVNLYRRPNEKVKKIYVTNMAGRVMKVIHDDASRQNATHYTWNGRSSNGRHLSSGVYIINVVTDKRHMSAKLPLVR